MLGIDLGTTNSLIAVWQDGRAQLIANARARLTTHPDRTVAAFKRFMGSDKQFELGGRQFSPEELSALVIGSLKQDAEAFLGHPVHEAVISVPAYFRTRHRTQKGPDRSGPSFSGL